MNNEWYIERYPGMETFSFLRMNYVVPMLMLAEHYKLSGEAERAEYYKQMAVGLGRKAGREKEIDSYLKEKGW
ncbi:MAG: hypothetical protein ACE5GL_03550 [Calditrichia bacterium]